PRFAFLPHRFRRGYPRATVPWSQKRRWQPRPDCRNWFPRQLPGPPDGPTVPPSAHRAPQPPLSARLSPQPEPPLGSPSTAAPASRSHSARGDCGRRHPRPGGAPPPAKVAVFTPLLKKLSTGATGFATASTSDPPYNRATGSAVFCVTTNDPESPGAPKSPE